MNGELMNDTLTLYQSGFPGARHPPTNPVVLYVSFRQADGKFEHVEIAEYLRPPIEGPHVIEGPGSSATTFPISDYAQKLLQQMAIKHDVRR
ncbi:hypothetical protein RvY_14461 [Ramazzottius varieornatus]|uniref:Uncharacterized protein n=1 Tax=Ramazzottius varieornatus TaxID=947166 RepID=A0A1D1VRD8_RAMVA|nr:hypothetical protein RvY_14461 [Ramazzottius varieornatus]